VSSLLIAAVLEELVYRGLLVSVCYLPAGIGWNALLLLVMMTVFALSHIWFGWAHVLAKLPLSATTMVTVLALGTVLPAIVAHVFFNYRIWRETRSRFSDNREFLTA
jgi:membrane protease YdiL (CAAX protease family)